MIIEKAIVEPLYEKREVTKRKTFHYSYEMFFLLLETVFLVSRKNGTISDRMEFYIKRD